jgi:uncharacterized protein (TIGR02145 family)
MKKFFFFLAMLASVAASAQVTHVEPVGANYTNKTVTFRVWWSAGSRDATHFPKVWVWVDFIKINSNNTTSGNSWTRAEVSSVSGGATSYDGSNRKGFWLVGNASTNYSATLTVQLNITETKFNWCAYASDYPPNVVANNGTYTLRGTPPFTLIAADGTTTQTVSGKTLAASALTITPSVIKDKTECPGVFCLYTGSDLYRDATHLCGRRASGAMNWEAWIKDVRDNELYRIVFLSDNKWWTAEEMRYDASSAKRSYKCPNGKQRTIYNRPNVACPSGWTLPSVAAYTGLRNLMSLAKFLSIGNHQYYGDGVDKYGFSLNPSALRSDIANGSFPSGDCNISYEYQYASMWDTLDGNRLCYMITSVCKDNFSWNQVRCIKQL